MEKLKILQRLEESLAKLPGVGKRSAERMAYAMLNMDDEDLKEFSDVLLSLKEKIHICPKCGNLCEDELCPICMDEDREQDTLLVVSYPKDVLTFEKSNSYHGLYHVLNGVISINKGSGVDSLNINSLINRVKKENIKEIIIATDATIEGETTALFIAKLLQDLPVNVTRIAYGLPMGGSIDYTDSLTINKALEGRRKI